MKTAGKGIHVLHLDQIAAMHAYLKKKTADFTNEKNEKKKVITIFIHYH